MFVHIPNISRSKLDARVEKCVFIDYAPNTRGYKCFNHVTKKIDISMDVFFVEQTPFFTKTPLQVEHKKEDELDIFWKTNNCVLPNVFVPNEVASSNFFSPNYATDFLEAIETDVLQGK